MTRAAFAPRALALAIGALIAVSAIAREAVLQVEVTHPRPGSEFGLVEPVLVAGNASLQTAPNQGLDVVVVLDVSASTGVPARQDVNGDGAIDLRESGPDSVLAAQALAAKRALVELEQPGVRAALVTFSGNPYPGWEPDPRVRDRPPKLERPHAILERKLGADFADLRRRVDEVAARPPWGVTDMGAGLSLALDALRRSGARRDRVVLFFTDGTPTSPATTPEDNLIAALARIPDLVAREVRVHTFALGLAALVNPEVPIRLADATGGYFTPVENVAELEDLARLVAGASVRDVAVRNVRTGQQASSVIVGHDGRWSALVALAPGPNRIEVTARTLGGEVRRRELTILGKSEGPQQLIPDDLGPEHRDPLLRVRLEQLRNRTSDLADKLRSELKQRMQAVQAQKQVEQLEQRRRLEIRTQTDAEKAAATASERSE